MANEQDRSARYAAFISYSHSDQSLADWLHKRLEGYDVPSSIRGRPGPSGPIGKRLGKVFRDRADLSAAHDLGAEIREGLEQSDALVVLCSPRSCNSRYVNDEIRLFKTLGKGKRVFAAIVDGEPHAAGKPGRTAADECFPRALIYRPGPDGATSDVPEDNEPVAADLREARDGRENGSLKIIAGLLDVGLDELVQREKAAQRRRQRRAYFLAGVMGVLALSAAGAAAYAFTQQQQADRRRVEVVATRARDLIIDGQRTAASAFLKEEAVDDALLRTGTGRWVLSQIENASWSPVAAASAAMAGCDASAVAMQDDANVATVSFAEDEPVSFPMKDRLLACFAHEDAVVLFDMVGNAYQLKAGGKPAETPSAAWLPHHFSRRGSGEVLLESQADGLISYDIARQAFTKVGSAGPDEDQRVLIIPAPIPDYYFSVRRSGLGRFFTPGETENKRAEQANKPLEALEFRDCAATRDAALVLCVMGDGTAALLDWDGVITPLPLNLAGRAASVLRINTSPQQFAIVDDQGGVTFMDTASGVVSEALKLAGGEAPMFVHGLGDSRVAIVGERGRVCIAMIGRFACELDEQAASDDGPEAIATPHKGRALWIRSADGSVRALTMDRWIMREGRGGGGKNAPARKIARISPTVTTKSARAADEGELLGGEVKVGGPPVLAYVSRDLSWRLQQTPGRGLQLVLGAQVFDIAGPEAPNRTVEARDTVWLQFEDRIVCINLAKARDGVVQLSAFDARRANDMWLLGGADLVLAQLADRTLLLREDSGFDGGSRLAIGREHVLGAFDEQRGLLLVSSHICQATLFDLDYPEAVLVSTAPCDRADAVAITGAAITISRNGSDFHTTLPSPYVSP